MSSNLLHVALTRYIAELADTEEFDVLECKTDYLLRVRAHDDTTCKTLVKALSKKGHETDAIGRVVVVLFKPGAFFISNALSRYSEPEDVPTEE